jgi:hypothetical protein
MALIFPGIKCSIREQPLDGELLKSHTYVATTHFIADPSHLLWRFSDSAMHQHCFENWEHRPDFIALYNQTMGSITWGDGRHHHMQDDGSISILKRENGRT